MGFQKGHAKLGGRKRGGVNRVTRDIREWARSILEDRQVQAMTLKQAREGKLQPGIVAELLHYAYGKPKDTLALELPRPAVVDLITQRPDGDGGEPVG